jgi:MerC mercury resistance protein
MVRYWKRWRWDGLGLGLATLCLVHCLATSVVLVLVASAGGYLLNPAIHEIGLVGAIMFGALALGKGYREHNLLLPAAIGAVGIGIMAGGLLLEHSNREVALTILGVGILAIGHILNHRAVRKTLSY